MSVIMSYGGKRYVLGEAPISYSFRLQKITVLVDKEDLVDIDLSCNQNNLIGSSSCQFSLLIGVNGVGKSSILRGIIDFFIDFKEYYDNLIGFRVKKYKKSVSKHLQVVGVRYFAHGDNYDIYKNDNEQKYFINNSEFILDDIPFPHIVASCFGIFDKFPIKNSFSSTSKSNRYNTPLYSYVGARASSNIFSTASAIFQMLYYVLNLEKLETILKVRELLVYMGYEDRMTFACKFNPLDKVDSFESFISVLRTQTYTRTNSRKQWYVDSFLKKTRQEQLKLFNYYMKMAKLVSNPKSFFRYDFEFNHHNVQTHKEGVRYLYLLRQLGIIVNADCYLYKKSQKVSCNDISSGELNLFCTVVGALSASEMENALILIDEPEISQHPNWQMSIIDFLNKGLDDCSCHFLIATHSHFLVSDLPRLKSSVSYLKYENSTFSSEKIFEETYGWSAEEVLLKVFKVPTTRNIYLAKIVGDLLDGIAQGKVVHAEVANQISFLTEVISNMNDVDPMKKVISTIIKTYKNED